MQILGFLRETDAGVAVKDRCRRQWFSEASYHLWRSKFGGLTVSDAKRLKVLEQENAQLKQLLAEALLEQAVTQEALRKSGTRTGSSGGGALDVWPRPERAACLESYWDECEQLTISLRPDRNGELRTAILALASRHRGMGRA